MSVPRRIVPVLVASAVLLAAGPAPADDPVDILGLASGLSTPPAGLKEVLGQLGGKKEVNSLAGRKASGKLNIRELYIEFGADGESVSAYTQKVTTEKPYTGKYTITGNKLKFTLGPSEFVGTVSDKGITGTRKRSDGVDDTWEVTFDK